MSGDSGHGSSHTDAYDELFHTPNVVDVDPLDSDQEETGNKVSFCHLVLDFKGQQHLSNLSAISVVKSRLAVALNLAVPHSVFFVVVCLVS